MPGESSRWLTRGRPQPAGKGAFAARPFLELLFQLEGLGLETAGPADEERGGAPARGLLLRVARRLRRLLAKLAGFLPQPADLLIHRSPLSPPVGLPGLWRVRASRVGGPAGSPGGRLGGRGAGHGHGTRPGRAGRDALEVRVGEDALV